MAQLVKNLPGMQETQVRSLDQEDPLEEGMATHSSILAWRIPRTEEPGGLQSMGSQRVRHDLLNNNSANLNSPKILSGCLVSLRALQGGSVVKNSPANAGDSGSISGSGISPGGGNGNPVHYSCLENPMDREAWQAIVYGVTKSRTQLK